ncbi:MAG TPA: hypothetical protein VGC75_00230 [Candidatus Nitrosocosmicus sp.]
MDTKNKPQKMTSKKKTISRYIIDETIINIGLHILVLWIVIDHKDKEILKRSISE